jgi:hypothetical protein
VLNRFEVALPVGQRTEEAGRLLAARRYETTFAVAVADGEAAGRRREDRDEGGGRNAKMASRPGSVCSVC